MSYKPNYTSKDIQAQSDKVNLSGKSPLENVAIEEAAQRAVAESEMWLIARKSNYSREQIEALGFTFLEGGEGLFWYTTPPQGWTKKTSGYWTTIFDESGRERATQFYKGAWYDERADITFNE